MRPESSASPSSIFPILVYSLPSPDVCGLIFIFHSYIYSMNDSKMFVGREDVEKKKKIKKINGDRIIKEKKYTDS